MVFVPVLTVMMAAVAAGMMMVMMALFLLPTLLFLPLEIPLARRTENGLVYGPLHRFFVQRGAPAL